MVVRQGHGQLPLEGPQLLKWCIYALLTSLPVLHTYTNKILISIKHTHTYLSTITDCSSSSTQQSCHKFFLLLQQKHHYGQSAEYIMLNWQNTHARTHQSKAEGKPHQLSCHTQPTQLWNSRATPEDRVIQQKSNSQRRKLAMLHHKRGRFCSKGRRLQLFLASEQQSRKIRVIFGKKCCGKGAYLKKESW